MILWNGSWLTHPRPPPRVPVELVAGVAGRHEYLHLPQHQPVGVPVPGRDSPIQLGSQWYWDGINDVTALAANISAQDTDQKHLFYSGVAFGVAAGAMISLVLELIPADPVKRDRGRGQQGAVSTRC